MGEIIISCGDVVKKKCTYHTVTLRQQGESQTALKSITVPFHWKYCRIMCSHMELASEKGKQTKPFPFRKWSEVPLRKPAAPVHCQVVTPAVLKPVCVVLRRNYHCSDRTHARTHELTRAVRAFGDQPTENQCARSQVDTHTHTHRATLMCLLFIVVILLTTVTFISIHYLSASLVVEMQYCIDITSGDATLQRH